MIFTSRYQFLFSVVVAVTIATTTAVLFTAPTSAGARLIGKPVTGSSFHGGSTVNAFVDPSKGVRTGVDQTEQEKLSFIRAGIEYNRTHLGEAHIIINSHLEKNVGYTEPIPTDQRVFANEFPNQDDAVLEYDTAPDEYLVKLKSLGNLEGDKGAKNWFEVESALLDKNGEISVMKKLRYRKPDSTGKIHEFFSWTGNLNVPQNVMRDHQWEIIRLTPHAMMYYVSLDIIDSILADEKYHARIVSTETIFGDKCFKLETNLQIPNTNRSYRALYWIDADHGFMLRQYKFWEQHAVRGVNKSLLLGTVTVPEVIKSGTTWFPKSFSSKLFYVIDWDHDNASHLLNNTQVSISPNDEKDPFAWKWPEGTRIRDNKTNQRFVGNADGTMKLVADTAGAKS